jgi:hypothetical protein
MIKPAFEDYFKSVQMDLLQDYLEKLPTLHALELEDKVLDLLETAGTPYPRAVNIPYDKWEAVIRFSRSQSEYADFERWAWEQYDNDFNRD